MEGAFEALVLQLGQVEGRDGVITSLRAAGEDAKPALLQGMLHPAWRVRFGCLLVLDHTIVDDPTRQAVVKALDDPHRKVRGAALHVLSCEACKPEGCCGIAGTDLEAACREMARHDRSGRVRRSAIGKLMWRSNIDEVTADAMRDVLATETNDDVRRRAAFVLAFAEVAGDERPRERRARLVATVESLLSQ